MGYTGVVTFNGTPGIPDFDAVYASVKRTFDKKVVRLQNPVLLLEHGMQICRPPLGALMFVMALDMLIMAGKTTPFAERLGGFLGPQSQIFQVECGGSPL